MQKGVIQAIELADFLASLEIDRIISRPFLRAVQSMEPFAKNQNLKIEVEPLLSERVLSLHSLPDWLKKLKATFEDMELKYDGGESSKEAMNRIVNVIEDILASDTRRTMIATHGNIMSLLLNYYDKRFGFDQWKKLSNPDIYRLIIVNKDVSIERIWKD